MLYYTLTYQYILSDEYIKKIKRGKIRENPNHKKTRHKGKTYDEIYGKSIANDKREKIINLTKNRKRDSTGRFIKECNDETN